MTRTIGEALQAIQCAMAARRHYFPEHPAVRDNLRRALSLLQNIFRQRSNATVFRVGPRIVCDNEVLAQSQVLASGLFAAMQARGFDCIVFERGLSEQDLFGLISRLDSSADPIPSAMTASSHLRLGSINRTGQDQPPPDRNDAPRDAAFPDRPEALAEAWKRGADGKEGAAEVLGEIVSGICGTVSNNLTRILPLMAIKRYDDYTYVHTINVAILSAALADSLGYNAQDVHDITVAAMLHDVGKQLIPPHLLRKNSQLSQGEFAVIQRHPLDGARLLFAARDLPPVAPIVAYEHHAKLDNSGYPHLPSGRRPHLASQIVQLADIFDALQTHRPYRQALPIAEAMQLMRKDAGRGLDSALLDVFMDRVAWRTTPIDAAVARLA